MADTSAPPPVTKARTFVRRTASTLGLWAVVTAALLSRQAWAYLGLTGVLMITAMIEYFRMLRTAKVACFPRFGIAAALVYSIGIHAYFVNAKSHGATTALILPEGVDAAAIFAVLAVSFFLQLRHPIRGLEALLSVAVTLLGFVYIAVCFNFAARLVFCVPGESQVPGAMLLLWVIAVTKFTDMGAYITGTLTGKRKMIPHVSPGKTWEGFAGALGFAQLAGCGLFALWPEQLTALGGWTHVIILGFIIALLAVIGDLAESVLKRSLNAKDSGRMLPGIGGSLDLIDSLCFTTPALYFYIKWVTASWA